MNHVSRFGIATTITFLFLIILSASQTVSAQLIISEFRVRGPNGANDEFIELYNNSGADHTVASAGPSTGYAVAASNGVARCVVPNGTVIPNRGHYLCVNSVGYSLASYPAGNGTTATGDATYTTDIPDNAGIAIFNTSVAANFVLANRLDAVGSTSEANTLYKEGTGYPALTPFSIDYSFYRDNCGKSGSITTLGQCPISTPKDTNNNAADFIFVDTNGTSAGAGQRLGAPGPENLSSPIQRNASFTVALLDPCVGSSGPPNRVRDFTSVPAQNSTFGTLDIRRTVTNNTGENVTRLRWRVIDLTTFPAPSGIADLRPRTSTAVVVTVDRAPCGSGTSNVTVQGTTLEQPPSQPNGGGFNSSLSSGTITLPTPLANGATIDVRFLLGIQQTGTFKFYVNVEALTSIVILPPAVRTEPVAAKHQKWDSWKAPVTGITDEPTPPTRSVPGTPSGWFVVVPTVSPDRRRATTTREILSLSERDAEENSNAPASKKLKTVPVTLDLSTSLPNAIASEMPVVSSARVPAAGSLSSVITSALVTGAVSGSTSVAPPATNAGTQKVSSVKERKSRKADGRRRTLRRR